MLYRNRKFGKVQKLLFYEPSAYGAYHAEAQKFPARTYQGVVLGDYLARREALRRTPALDAKRALSRDIVVAVPGKNDAKGHEVVGSDVTLLTGKLFHYKMQWEKSEVSLTIENTRHAGLFRCSRGSTSDGEVFFLGTGSAIADFLNATLGTPPRRLNRRHDLGRYRCRPADTGVDGSPAYAHNRVPGEDGGNPPYPPCPSHPRLTPRASPPVR